MPFLAEQKAKATLLGDCAPTRVLMASGGGGLCRPCVPRTAGSGVLWLSGGWVAAECGAL